MTGSIAEPVTRSGGRTGLLIPLGMLSHRLRGGWRFGRQALGLIVGYRNLRGQSLHLLPAEQGFDLVIRQVLPMWIAKRDPFLPGEPDAPRRPRVKREPIPSRLEAQRPVGVRSAT